MILGTPEAESLAQRRAPDNFGPGGRHLVEHAEPL
jgi:hypothetical protein